MTTLATRAAPGASALFALIADPFQPRLDRLDARTQQPAVCLELRFTRASQTNAALLALQVSPPSNQTRAHMGQLRQLHLQLAFVGARTLCKNIEDQTSARQHSA